MTVIVRYKDNVSDKIRVPDGMTLDDVWDTEMKDARFVHIAGLNDEFLLIAMEDIRSIYMVEE